jgi:methylated-DNA-[protein]-cysteine S-methyltransferase
MGEPVTASRACAAAVVGAPFGGVEIHVDGDCITRLHFVQGGWPVAAKNELAAEAVAQLRRYFMDPEFRFTLPLEVRGTPFQRRVWAAIAGVGSGTTATYGDLARALDAPARAVGQACGDNRLPIVIPCHRVVGVGGLGGFAHASGGFPATVKRWLLEHEGALRGTLL